MTTSRVPFFLICAILVVLAGAFSYYRFMVAEDYTAEYEGECDPATERCFVGCEDEECSEVYYYSIVQKHAADLRAQCGPDITDCAEASLCLPEDTVCSITYCSDDEVSEDETCEDLTAVNFDEEEGNGEEDVEAEDEESSPDGLETDTSLEPMPL